MDINQPKRKHVRTRTSKFDRKDLGGPGRFRIHLVESPGKTRYVGSFVLNADQTCDFYGVDLAIFRDDG